jgi:hypothetical protein
VAFGFPAYHVADISLPLPITDEWIGYTAQAAGLVFQGRRQEPAGWYWSVTANMDLMSWGSNVKIWALGAQQIRIRSECVLPTQCIDWGKNQEVVQRLANIITSEMQRQAYHQGQG